MKAVDCSVIQFLGYWMLGYSFFRMLQNVSAERLGPAGLHCYVVQEHIFARLSCLKK